MDDCIIVGGGLIGMLTARELARQGLSVRLIDRGELGQEASWAGGGILSPLYPWRYPDAVNRLASYGQARYADLTRQLFEESSVDAEWEPSGLLMLNVSDLDQALSWAVRHGIEHEWLNAEGLLHCEPALAGFGDEGVWLPGVAQLRNPRLMRALKGSLKHYQVEIETGNPVRGFLISGGRIKGVDSESGSRKAAMVVVSGGAWTAGLLESWSPPPVKPVRGQMIVFRAEPGQLRRIILHTDRYLIPRRDGRIVVGSTLEDVGFDASVTDEARHSLMEAAFMLMPALKGMPVERHWAGLRPASPAGVPVVAEHPRVRGLFINAGHYRNGVVIGLGSVRVLVDQMLGRTAMIDKTPYAYPMSNHE